MSKSKQSNIRRKPAGRTRLPILIVGAGVILLGVVVFLATRSSSAYTPPADYTPEVSGAPHLAVDRDKVDLGEVKLGQTVQVSVDLRNNGSQPLIFTKAPYIEVKEGC